MTYYPPPPGWVPPPPHKGIEFRVVLRRGALVATGILVLLYGSAVLHERGRKHLPVPDTSVRAADIRTALPPLVPTGGMPIRELVVGDVLCKPLTPASATQVLHVPGNEEQVELWVRRQMAQIGWRDLPDRSHIEPSAVTMRYEHGVGQGKGTLTYVLTADQHGTKVQLGLVGSISGRCGVS